MFTNCSAERPLSKLKLIKNRLRTSLSEDRLNVEHDILRQVKHEDIANGLWRSSDGNQTAGMAEHLSVKTYGQIDDTIKKACRIREKKMTLTGRPGRPSRPKRRPPVHMLRGSRHYVNTSDVTPTSCFTSDCDLGKLVVQEVCPALLDNDEEMAVSSGCRGGSNFPQPTL
ncbi:hypothetical protein J6590_052838 [Homalodisca vitripennis]|nr:hypothetical protein J6590_052838 [Homalodisca vitripennis]